MLSKCSNPSCTSHMKYLHDGRLFVIESQSAKRYWRADAGQFGAPRGKQIECFWLCRDCAGGMTITAAGELTMTIPAHNFSTVLPDLQVAA
jgi:hypothetical protein